MSMTTPIAKAERQARLRAVEEATQSSEMEGLQASPEYRADAEAYVEGEFDVDELVRRTRARYGLA
jgi:hypothetical protein